MMKVNQIQHGIMIMNTNTKKSLDTMWKLLNHTLFKLGLNRRITHLTLNADKWTWEVEYRES